MIEIDGSFGEGGGQILRTALSLSMISGKAFRIFNLRGARKKPGLRAQHLAAVRAAMDVCAARCEGDSIGSVELAFEPGDIMPGKYSFDIGTAGSTMLVLQTLLPALSIARSESGLVISGGTHNPNSPPFEYINECFRPAVREIGIDFSLELVRYGFYPRGGGEIKAKIFPPTHVGEIESPGMDAEVDWGMPEAEVILANLPLHIAEREREVLVKNLGISGDDVKFTFPPGESGPGNVVLIRFRAGERTGVFASFGEKGKRAESVARDAARDAKNFARSRAAVDPRLADQLALYLALGKGGRFLTSQSTEHLRTNIQVIRKFLDISCEVRPLKPDLYLVDVSC